MVTPTVVPQGRPTVKPGTVPGSRVWGASVVLVVEVGDVVVEPGSGPASAGTVVGVLEGLAAATAGGGASPRVTRNTARPSTNPATTIRITWPALSFTVGCLLTRWGAGGLFGEHRMAV
jgi:hypothetical protein